MPNFWDNQLDYLFYMPGLAFLIMAVICFSLRNQRDQRLPWTWLGLFCAVQCFYHWFNLFANCVGESQFFMIIRACVMAISFFLLGKFAYAGTINVQGKRSGLISLSRRSCAKKLRSSTLSMLIQNTAGMLLSAWVWLQSYRAGGLQQWR